MSCRESEKQAKGEMEKVVLEINNKEEPAALKGCQQHKCEVGYHLLIFLKILSYIWSLRVL